MSDANALFILMHSNQDWLQKLGEGADVDGFLDWLWHQDDAAAGESATWVERKVNEFKSL